MAAPARSRARKVLHSLRFLRAERWWMWLAIAVTVALGSGLVGCQAPTPEGPATSELGPEDPHEVASLLVDEALRVLAVDNHPGRLTAAEIEEAAARSLDDPTVHLYDRVWLQRVRAGHGPIFVDASGPSGAGRALLGVVRELPMHGLDADDFQHGAIEQALRTFEEERAVPPPPELTRVERQRLVDALLSRGTLPRPTDLAHELVRADSPLHVPHLAASVEALRHHRQQRASGLGRLEMLMADAAVRLGLEMRIAVAAGRADALPWTLRSSTALAPPADFAHGDFDEPVGAQLEVHRLGELFEALAPLRGEPTAAARLLGGLEPQSPDYRALRDVYQHYLAVGSHGGWTPLPEVALGDPELLAVLGRLLRERLAAEGLLDPEGAWATDVEVAQALGRARERYGVGSGTGLDPALLAALNVPVQARLHQLAFNLQRWRRLPVDGNQTFVQVNLPSSDGYVVRNGARLLRFGVRPARAEVLSVPTFSGHVAVVLVEPSGAGPRIELKTVNPSPVRLVDLSHATCATCYGIDRAVDVAHRLLQMTGLAHLDVRKMTTRTSISLNPRLPLHVTYFTATIATDRSVRFHPDPWGEDGDLAQLGQIATTQANANVLKQIGIP